MSKRRFRVAPPATAAPESAVDGAQESTGGASVETADREPRRTFPHPLTILLLVTLLVWVAAMFIPSGQYETDEDGRPIAGSFHQIESPLTFSERVTDLLHAPINGLYGVKDAQLGLASVGFNKYIKFILPLMGIWLVIMLVVFSIAAL